MAPLPPPPHPPQAKLQKRAQHWPRLNRTIGAELSNLTASVAELRLAMNSTSRQVNEAKVEAEETRQAVKLATIERQVSADASEMRVDSPPLLGLL